MASEDHKSGLLSEDDITAYTLDAMETYGNDVPGYPGGEFDARALSLLCIGIRETLAVDGIEPAGGRGYRFVKRAFDVVTSAVLLLVLLLPLGILMLALTVEEHSAPILSQVRLTENGRPFRMYRLRTCHTLDPLPSLDSEDTPRLTEVGRFARRSGLSELPLLFNVLKGDMSLIGPPPLRPHEALLCTPTHLQRMKVRSGVAYAVDVDGSAYVRTRSVPLDLRLLLDSIADGIEWRETL